MQKQKQLKTAQDYLDAADRKFENADALAATELLCEAMTHTVKVIAGAKGWAYDEDHVYPVVERLAGLADLESEVITGWFAAAEGYPNKVRYGYFVWSDGDSHVVRKWAHDFIHAMESLAGNVHVSDSWGGGAMLTQQPMQTAQDLLDAADREFENADAVAATESLWSALRHTVKTAAKAKGLSYDDSDLFPVLEQLVSADEQCGEILLTSFLAAKAHPGLFSAGYLKFETGDTHRVRRLAHEFVSAMEKLAK